MPKKPDCDDGNSEKELISLIRFLMGDFFNSISGVVNTFAQQTQTRFEQIMSAISEFATKQNAFNDRIDSAVTGLQGDVESLKALIEQLQNSAGQVTPEDQALLDQIQARTESVATKLEALDALTPPTPPPAP